MAIVAWRTSPAQWELAAETIAVKIRWFGLVVGYLLVNLDATAGANALALNALLGVGAAYALTDTYYSLRGRIFLARFPLAISLMEALFIGLLCYYDAGLDSWFRYYYFLSLICVAIRYPSAVTYATCGLQAASYVVLFFALPAEQRDIRLLVLHLVLMGWVTWAASGLALLLKRATEHWRELNGRLRQHQVELEERIAERTRELHDTQAHVLHQEKMAAFGLLAAGIAHEVGNPLTSISSLVQMLQRRSGDAYAQEKMALVNGELKRIQGTLRELVNFSRPAATERVWVGPEEVICDALNIAKYYKRTRGRTIETKIAPDLPRVLVVRDQLVQAVLNLVLNAIDATDKGGRIEVGIQQVEQELRIEVRDNGHGIPGEHARRLFQPYFTTKPQGTGLGLFVTSKLVADHGGRVSFDSRPGEGAVFRIHLPAHNAGAEANSVHHAAGAGDDPTYLSAR